MDSSSLRKKLEYYLATLRSYKTISVNNSKAKFQFKTPSERKRFQNLMGEKKIISNLLEEINRDDVFYDVGANVGTYTLLVAKTGIDRIVAFEPHPQNVSHLKNNLDLNNTSATIEQSALSDKNDKVSLKTDTAEAGAGGHHISESGEMSIQCYEGDYKIENDDLPRPDLVKIDVEGAEMEVIEGMTDTLSDHVRCVYCEIHLEHVNRNKVYDKLHDLGFEVETLEVRGTEEFVKGSKNLS